MEKTKTQFSRQIPSGENYVLENAKKNFLRQIWNLGRDKRFFTKDGKLIFQVFQLTKTIDELVPLVIFLMMQGALGPKSDNCETELNAPNKKSKKQCFFSKFEKNGFSIVMQVERGQCLIQLVQMCNVSHNLYKLTRDIQIDF